MLPDQRYKAKGQRASGRKPGARSEPDAIAAAASIFVVRDIAHWQLSPVCRAGPGEARWWDSKGNRQLAYS
jgi:hypothetical protein